MTLRIAFCGPNIEVCDRLSREAKDFIYSDVIELEELGNPMKEVLERAKKERFNTNDLDWLNMWATAVRRMDIEGAREVQAVISSSCGIDQVALQATWLTEQMNFIQNQLVITDATGQGQMSEADAMVNRSGAIVQVLLNSAEEETVEFWDFVYAVMPAASKLSKTPSEIVFQYSDFLGSVPAFSGVTRLPDNFEAAVDALKNEVPKWKAKLLASS